MSIVPQSHLFIYSNFFLDKINYKKRLLKIQEGKRNKQTWP